MTKGLVLKILAITIVAGGLVFANELVSAKTGAAPAFVAPPAPAAKPAAQAANPATAIETPVPAALQDEPQQQAPLAARRPRAMRPGPRADLANGETNFVSVCRYSHSNQDDPIVYPKAPGATHHHDFFANTTTNADSTLASLRAGGSTCKIAGDTAAYWAPALFVDGKVVQPTLARIYYRPGQKDNKTVRAFPAGLKVLAKDDNVRATWSCVGRDQERTRPQSTPPTCPAGTQLVEHIRFADCWDGKHLDTPDHVSNMTFARRGCPASHPVGVPAITLNIHYPTQGGNVALGFPDKPVAAHADFFNAWDQPTLERLVRECINAGVHCGANPPGSNARDPNA